jgi:hypothetical protein
MFKATKNDDVAALYAFYQPTQGPFIIVPSIAKPEIQADFTLTSKYILFILLNLCFIFSFLVSTRRNLNVGRLKE